jgi:predicted naringenin-chalcone synthase
LALARCGLINDGSLKIFTPREDLNSPRGSSPKSWRKILAVYINRIATAVPPHDIHRAFLNFARFKLAADSRKAALFDRMAERSGITHRYACMPADALVLSTQQTGGPSKFYGVGNFPDTATRMQAFEQHAPLLASAAVERLALEAERDRITHLLITSCTGQYAPGVDFDLMERCQLPNNVERTTIGFMGCYAAVNALKLARHIVRSQPDAHVLIVNIELCSLHLQETSDLQELLSYLLFGDGCAACLVTAEPEGIALDSFHAAVVPGTRGLITWHVRNSGFDMALSGQVPAAIEAGLRGCAKEILRSAAPASIDLWAVHPGGRTVLDAVEKAFDLPSDALTASRDVLNRYGNMSSVTIMFVLERMLHTAVSGGRGCAMSFGPGLVAETMLFRTVSVGPSLQPTDTRPFDDRLADVFTSPT